jgi:hypothetical protein
MWSDWLTEKQKAIQATLPAGSVLPDDWFTQPIPAGVDSSKWPGLKPPDEYLKVRALENAWGKTDMGSPEYTRIAQQIFDYYVKNLYRIGVVGEIPSIMIASNKLGNVLKPGWVKGLALDYQVVTQWIDQIYFK